MKFIYADSLDYVDPGYNFEKDEFSAGRQPYWDDVFAHELLATPPYDGLLVSRALLGGAGVSGKYSEAQSMRFVREGARRFLRLDREEFKGLLIFGDCGSFSYRNLLEPPYHPSEMIEFYDTAQFTHGCSIDHIIFDFVNDGTPTETAKARFDLTLSLASEFLRECKSQDVQFTPIGVVQGWSPASMANASKALTRMGYRYLAVGGLVPLGMRAIRNAVSSVYDAVRGIPNIRIHLLGFAKAHHIEELKRYAVASFDSTSPLIRAFKDNARNYWQISPAGTLEYFSAIRVPQADRNVRLMNRIKRGEVSQESLMELERQALQTLRYYDQFGKNLQETVEAVIQYSRHFLESPSMQAELLDRKLDGLRRAYVRTLTAMPWKKCFCDVCQQCSIEVVIFRASNRNKRRGIHNLHAFHKYIGQIEGETA